MSITVDATDAGGYASQWSNAVLANGPEFIIDDAFTANGGVLDLADLANFGAWLKSDASGNFNIRAPEDRTGSPRVVRLSGLHPGWDADWYSVPSGRAKNIVFWNCDFVLDQSIPLVADGGTINVQMRGTDGGAQRSGWTTAQGIPADYGLERQSMLGGTVPVFDASAVPGDVDVNVGVYLIRAILDTKVIAGDTARQSSVVVNMSNSLITAPPNIIGVKTSSNTFAKNVVFADEAPEGGFFAVDSSVVAGNIYELLVVKYPRTGGAVLGVYGSSTVDNDYVASDTYADSVFDHGGLNTFGIKYDLQGGAVTYAPAVLLSNRTLKYVSNLANAIDRNSQQLGPVYVWDDLDYALVNSADQVFSSAQGFLCVSRADFDGMSREIPVDTAGVPVPGGHRLARQVAGDPNAVVRAEAWSYQVVMAPGKAFGGNAFTTEFSVPAITDAKFPKVVNVPNGYTGDNTEDKYVIQNYTAKFGPNNVDPLSSTGRTVEWLDSQQTLVREMGVVFESTAKYLDTYEFIVRITATLAGSAADTYDIPVTMRHNVYPAASPPAYGVYGATQRSTGGTGDYVAGDFDAAARPLLQTKVGGALTGGSDARTEIAEGTTKTVTAETKLDPVANFDIAWTDVNAQGKPQHRLGAHTAAATPWGGASYTWLEDYPAAALDGTVSYKLEYPENSIAQAEYTFERALSASWTRSGTPATLAVTPLYAKLVQDSADQWEPRYAAYGTTATSSDSDVPAAVAEHDDAHGYLLSPSLVSSSGDALVWGMKTLGGIEPCAGFYWRPAHGSAVAYAYGALTVTLRCDFSVADAAGWAVDELWATADATQGGVTKTQAQLLATKGSGVAGTVGGSGTVKTLTFSIPENTNLTQYYGLMATFAPKDSNAYAVSVSALASVNFQVYVSGSTEAANDAPLVVDAGATDHADHAAWKAANEVVFRFRSQANLLVLRNGATYAVSGDGTGAAVDGAAPSAAGATTTLTTSSTLSPSHTVGARLIGNHGNATLKLTPFVYNTAFSPDWAEAAAAADSSSANTWIYAQNAEQTHNADGFVDFQFSTKTSTSTRDTQPVFVGVRVKEADRVAVGGYYLNGQTTFVANANTLLSAKAYLAAAVNIVTDNQVGVTVASTVAGTVQTSTVKPVLTMTLNNTPAADVNVATYLYATMELRHYDADGARMYPATGAFWETSGTTLLSSAHRPVYSSVADQPTNGQDDTFNLATGTHVQTVDLSGLVGMGVAQVQVHVKFGDVGGGAGAASLYATTYEDYARVFALSIDMPSATSTQGTERTAEADRVYLDSSFRLVVVNGALVVEQLINGVWVSGPSTDLTANDAAWQDGATSSEDALFAPAQDATHGSNEILAKVTGTTYAIDAATAADNVTGSTAALTLASTGPSVGDQFVVFMNDGAAAADSTAFVATASSFNTTTKALTLEIDGAPGALDVNKNLAIKLVDPASTQFAGQ